MSTMGAVDHRAAAVGRRRFLGWGLAGSATFMAAGLPTPAGAADCDTMEIYMLESDWGYPRGPGSKVRLVSQASRNAAMHRVARSRADAEAMNLHLCSHAPAVARTVRRAEFEAFWAASSYVWTSPWSGLDVRILDLRHVYALPDGPARWDQVNRPCDPTPRSGALGSRAVAAPGAAPRGTLPRTGADGRIARAGAVLVGTGAALMALRRRLDRDGDQPDPA